MNIDKQLGFSLKFFGEIGKDAHLNDKFEHDKKIHNNGKLRFQNDNYCEFSVCKKFWQFSLGTISYWFAILFLLFFISSFLGLFYILPDAYNEIVEKSGDEVLMFFASFIFLILFVLCLIYFLFCLFTFPTTQ